MAGSRGKDRNSNAGSPASGHGPLSSARMRALLLATRQLFNACPKCAESHNGTRDAHCSFLDLSSVTSGGDLESLRMYCHFCRAAPTLQGAPVIQIRRNTYNDGEQAAITLGYGSPSEVIVFHR